VQSRTEAGTVRCRAPAQNFGYGQNARPVDIRDLVLDLQVDTNQVRDDIYRLVGLGAFHRLC
jgi:hypothetical protein